jgi:YesN/AraC family two-component response regulator
MILIIDDDVAVCESAVLSLEMSGLQAGFCAGFAPARSLLSETGLVFLDITMPGISGLQALEEIRETHPCLPVVMFTGVGDLNTAVSCMKMGAVDYLVKPVEPEDLCASALEHLPTKKDRPACVRCFDHQGMASLLRDFDPARFPANAEPEARPLADWLARNFSDTDCSMQKAARELGSNTTYLSRMVARQWNMPFRQVVNMLRLACFIQLASRHDHEQFPLEGLARKAGWATRSTFFGTVKYHTGLTPSELIALAC